MSALVQSNASRFASRKAIVTPSRPRNYPGSGSRSRTARFSRSVHVSSTSNDHR